MKPLSYILASLLPLAIAPSVTQAKITYSTYAADSAISRGQGNGLSSTGTPLVSYEHGEFQWALRLLYERTGNQSYYDYIQEGVDRNVADNGTVGGAYNFSSYQLDPLRVGPSFIYLYNTTGEAKYQEAADLFRSQLETHPRTTEGQFWHKLMYPNQGWLDGIYMGSVFYATYTATFQPTNQSAWDDVLLQFTLMHNHTLQLASTVNTTDNETYLGLLYHGYDNSFVQDWASPDRGHSPEVWDRALGWYMMALVDVLNILDTTPALSPHSPNSTLDLAPHRATLTGYLSSLSENLIEAATKYTTNSSDVWWLVMTQPFRAGNYFESSGGPMYVYSILRGIRLGYIDDSDGRKVDVLKKSYEYMIDNWVIPQSNGTMDWNNTVVVGSLQPGNDYEYYISQAVDINDLKGVASFVLASYEYELL